jgi:hypothetical protein
MIFDSIRLTNVGVKEIIRFWFQFSVDPEREQHSDGVPDRHRRQKRLLGPLDWGTGKAKKLIRFRIENNFSSKFLMPLCNGGKF